MVRYSSKTDSDNLRFSRICKGKRYSYSVCEDGTVIKTSHVGLMESKVKPFFNEGNAVVSIAGKNMILKHLVAAHFLNYTKGQCVINIDGDPFNCSSDNLKVMTMQEVGKQYGHMSRGNAKRIMVNGTIYKSLKECARLRYVGYQTLRDYISGKSKNSILQGTDIRFIE